MKTTFLEYHISLDGFDYFKDGVQVFRYELYHRNIDANRLLKGLTKYSKQPKKKHDVE